MYDGSMIELTQGAATTDLAAEQADLRRRYDEQNALAHAAGEEVASAITARDLAERTRDRVEYRYRTTHGSPDAYRAAERDLADRESELRAAERKWSDA